MTSITITGNATQDVDLKFLQSGQAVASLNVADNHRKRNAAGEWEDDGATFYRCTIWGQMAENVAASIEKGQRVVVTGRVRNREWTDKEGGKRLSLEIDVDEIGPSLRYATAQVQRTERATFATQQQAPAPQQRTQQARKPAPTVDPWAHQPQAAQFDYEPAPF